MSVSNVLNLKCCKCCRWCNVFNVCATIKGYSYGIWNSNSDCSNGGSPTDIVSRNATLNKTTGLGNLCGSSSTYYDNIFYSNTSITGEKWYLGMGHDTVADTCYISLLYCKTCTYSGGGPSQYITYNGYYTLPFLCDGCRDDPLGYSFTLSITDSTQVGSCYFPNYTDSQPPTLNANIKLGSCTLIGTTNPILDNKTISISSTILRTIIPVTNKEKTTDKFSLKHPCKYELEILERCVECGNNDLNHVRVCEKLGKCTRGDLRRNDIQSCSNCSYYVSPYGEE